MIYTQLLILLGKFAKLIQKVAPPSFLVALILVQLKLGHDITSNHALHRYLAAILKKFFLILPFSTACYLIYAGISYPLTSPATTPEPGNNLRARLFLILLATAISGLFITAFYPGVMTPDSYAQYAQALRFSFSDWHPPILAVTWALTDKIIKGPGGIFLIQVLLAVYSLYLLSRVALLNKKTLYFLPLFGIFLPFVCNIIFVIWKDIFLAVSLLLAFSLWYFWKTSGKLTKSRFAVVIAISFYGATARHNSLPAVVPLWFIFLLDYTKMRTAIVWSLLTAVVFTISNAYLVYTVLDTKKAYLFQIIMVHDLMGIYDFTGKNYFPPEYFAKSQLDQLMVKFDHRTLNPTFVHQTYVRNQRRIIGLLRRRWLIAILQNPGAYLTHRSRVFDMDGFVYPLAWLSSTPPDSMKDIARPLLHVTPLGEIHKRYVQWVFKKCPYLFQGITFIVGSLLILLYSYRRKIVRATALTLCCLSYMAPYFIIAPQVDFRFIYWAVIATLLSLYVIWIERKEPAYVPS